jgi:hypothetical protein
MSWLTVPEPGHALILTAAFRNLEKLRGYSRMSDLAGSKGVPYGDESFTWSWLTVTGTWREYEPRVCEVVEQAFQTGQHQV